MNHTSTETCTCFPGGRPFPSACGTYSKAQQLLATFAAGSYASQKAQAKGRRFRYNPPQVQRELIQAMNQGDETSMKGLMLELRDALGGLYSSSRWE